VDIAGYLTRHYCTKRAHP